MLTMKVPTKGNLKRGVLTYPLESIESKSRIYMCMGDIFLVNLLCENKPI